MAKKETYYFSHDYSTTNDPKIQALLGKFGAKGYGIYWRVVEMLHEDPNHKIFLKPYMYEALSSTFKEDVKIIKDVIKYMIEVCELFIKEDEFIYSERVLANIDKRNKIKEARSLAGKRSAEKRAIVKQNSANVELTATNERKLKESKKVSKPKIDYDILLTNFNKIFKKNNRVFNEANKGKYSARIKEGYTIKEIVNAMVKASLDEFHKDNKFKYCTLEYFSRSTTIDKYAFDSTIKNKYIPTK